MYDWYNFMFKSVPGHWIEFKKVSKLLSDLTEILAGNVAYIDLQWPQHRLA